MKSFKENKERVKIFTEILNENKDELSDLVKDLESLGIKDQTYSISDIETCWGYVLSKDILDNGDYSETEIIEEFKTRITEQGNECYFEVEFTGSINIKSVDVDIIVKYFLLDLSSDDENYEQKRWTVTEIKEALESIDWEDYIAIDSSDVEVIVSDMSIDGANGTIEYEVDPDSFSIDSDTDSLLEEFKAHLGVE